MTRALLAVRNCIILVLFLATGAFLLFWLLLPYHPYRLEALGVAGLLVGLGIFAYLAISGYQGRGTT